MPSGDPSLLSYYRENRFNPVPVSIDTPELWRKHVERRLNLYQRHLGVPVGWLNGRSVLEIGPNAGENALVLAAFGADLTLVEPNEQVIPRLRSLFQAFGLERRLRAVQNLGIDDIAPAEPYDLVLAEGFLYTLPNRDALVGRLIQSLAPGGMLVVSFNDRYGMLLEMLRRAVLWRACRLAGVDDPGSPAALDLARRLYADDFAALTATRPFEAWWKDTLVNPLIPRMWSYQELLGLAAADGCEFHGSSPVWADVDAFSWYKRTPDPAERHSRLLARWGDLFSYFLTGIAPRPGACVAPAPGLVRNVAASVAAMSEYGTAARVQTPAPPEGLAEYLAATSDPACQALGRDLEQVFAALSADEPARLIEAYHGARQLRGLWGAPYHYLSLLKPPVPPVGS